MANSFLMDNDGDIMIKNGDFVIGNADGQCTVNNMLICEGQLRYAPLHGAGVRNSILSKGSPVATLHKVQQKLKLDKANVNSVKWVNDHIMADATWDV